MVADCSSMSLSGDTRGGPLPGNGAGVPAVGRNPVWVAVLVLVLGVGLSVAVALRAWDRERNEAEARLAAGGEVLAISIAEVFGDVSERLVALGALYQASDEVDRQKFDRFVSNLDLMSGMGGIGYMPVVADSRLDAFVAEVRKSTPGFRPFELDGNGNRVPVDRTHREHVLVEWFSPPDAYGRPQGFDSASNPVRRAALDRARQSGEITATGFVRLVSTTDTDGFLLYWPVTDFDSGKVVGFTVAPMDLSDLVQGKVPPSVAGALDWTITDLTATTDPVAPSKGEWFQDLTLGGRTWRLEVSPKEGNSLIDDGANPVLALLVGLTLTLAAVAGVYWYRQRTQHRIEIAHLKSLSEAKDQFLEAVSHELRTPLTAVVGFAQLLREPDGDLDSEERLAMIASVADQATDLSALIDDLLVAARFQLDTLAVHLVPVSLQAQAAQVLEGANPHLQSRAHLIDNDPHQRRATGDPARVRQIIRGLLQNATRYGGDTIEVRVTSTVETVHLQVADNGDGLPPEQWERIFEPYYRAHHSDTQPAGLGIGLAVAKHLAHLMHGHLNYRHEDDWSVFELALPAATSNRHQPSAVEDLLSDSVAL